MWLGIYIAISPAASAPDSAALREAWEAHRPALETHAVHPFRFEPDIWETVALGRVAKRRDRLDGTDRVIGVHWVSADIDTTWLAIHDPHGEAIEGTVYEVLPGSTTDKRFAYQRISLPWPLTSRQWVIEITNNLPLMAATSGRVWERSWRLSDRRGAKSESKDALWLPVNEGGWFLTSSAGGTLLVYHVRTSVGGVVPDEAAVRWAFSTLDRLLTGIAERTAWVRTHYRGDHAPLPRMGDTPVPLFP